MSGKFVEARVYQVIQEKYEDIYKPALRAVNLNKLNKEDTYMLIFSPGQEENMLTLLECEALNILYISKKAVNKRSGHGTAPRNTLVIFELK